jgi:hypothetical protein
VILGPKKISSGEEFGNPPSLLSLEKKDRKIDRYLWENLQQVGVRLPEKLVTDFYLFCEENGYHRQYGRVLASLIVLLLGGKVSIELSKPSTKTDLRPQLEEREIRSILEELDNSRRRRASSTYIQELQERLAKAAKKTKLTPEIEQQVRRELNLI